MASIETRLEALRARRLKLGVSLDELASRTRIPVAHLQALESGRFQDLPAGPYMEGYYRVVASALGVRESPAAPAPTADSPTSPTQPRTKTGLVALVGVGGALLVAVVGWLLSGSTEPSPAHMALPPPKEPDQVLQLLVKKTAQFMVFTDDTPAFRGMLRAGDRKVIRAHHRIELHIEGAKTVRLHYNGQPIVPQGRQNVPFKLIFIDDMNPESP